MKGSYTYASCLLGLMIGMCLLSNIHASKEQATTSEYSYLLEHALEADEDWETCGVLKTRVTEYKDNSYKPVFHGVKVVYDKLGESSKAALQKLVKQDGFYRLKVSTMPVASGAKSTVGKTSILTSLKAKCLAVNQFKDHFNLHFDEDGKTLISVEHTVNNKECSDATVHEIQTAALALGPTTSSVKFAKVAPQLSVIERSRPNDSGEGAPLDSFADDEAEEDEKKPKQPESWLQRNWMMALAIGMMVLNIVGSAMEPPRQRQQGQARAAQSR